MSKAYIFVETGEVRNPRLDEWFVLDGSPHNAGCAVWKEMVSILRRIEVEVPTIEEVHSSANSTTAGPVGPEYNHGFECGACWLASKLGLTPD